jgi:hypothetical protein
MNFDENTGYMGGSEYADRVKERSGEDSWTL